MAPRSPTHAASSTITTLVGLALRGVPMLLALQLAVASGCADATAPTASRLSTPASPVPAPPFPAPTRAGAIYQEVGDPYAPWLAYHHGHLVSRFVLHDDGSFLLQFSGGRFGFFEYPGRYARTGDRLTFAFEGWSAIGPWEATGTLDGDSLRVAYNAVMLMSDFLDGTYVLSPP